MPATHAAVIKKFCRVPGMKVDDPPVKSTPANLESATKGEGHERDEMYPAFNRRARTDATMKALQTFRFAHAAELEHAKLYAAALQHLESMRASGVSTYVRSMVLPGRNPILGVVQPAQHPRSVLSR